MQVYKLIEICQNLKKIKYERVYSYTNNSPVFFRTNEEAKEQGKRSVESAKRSIGNVIDFRVEECELPSRATIKG